MTATDWSRPIPQGVTTIFDASETVDRLVPPLAQIPGEAIRGWAGDFLRDPFFNGAKLANLTQKPGIDRVRAVRHIKAIMGSGTATSEHKAAACAYLLASWFEEPGTDGGVK